MGNISPSGLTGHLDQFLDCVLVLKLTKALQVSRAHSPEESGCLFGLKRVFALGKVCCLGAGKQALPIGPTLKLTNHSSTILFSVLIDNPSITFYPFTTTHHDIC